jgi:two-component system response regulator FixJ
MVHIIDDDSSIRRAIKMLAKSANFEIDDFSGADEFLQCESIKDGDCLILDINMPGKNGFELLKELEVRGTKVKVIILTAFDDSGNRELARSFGVKAFFRKPCDSQALIDTINYLQTQN